MVTPSLVLRISFPSLPFRSPVPSIGTHCQSSNHSCCQYPQTSVLAENSCSLALIPLCRARTESEYSHLRFHDQCLESSLEGPP